MNTSGPALQLKYILTARLRPERLLSCLFSRSWESRTIHRWYLTPAGMQHTFLSDIYARDIAERIFFCTCKCGPTPKHSGEKQAAQSLL